MLPTATRVTLIIILSSLVEWWIVFLNYLFFVHGMKQQYQLNNQVILSITNLRILLMLLHFECWKTFIII